MSNIRKGWCDAVGPENRHQRNAKDDLQVRIQVNWLLGLAWFAFVDLQRRYAPCHPAALVLDTRPNIVDHPSLYGQSPVERSYPLEGHDLNVDHTAQHCMLQSTAGRCGS